MSSNQKASLFSQIIKVWYNMPTMPTKNKLKTLEEKIKKNELATNTSKGLSKNRSPKMRTEILVFVSDRLSEFKTGPQVIKETMDKFGLKKRACHNYLRHVRDRWEAAGDLDKADKAKLKTQVRNALMREASLTTAKAGDRLRAIELLTKLEGLNEPDKQEVSHSVVGNIHLSDDALLHSPEHIKGRVIKLLEKLKPDLEEKPKELPEHAEVQDAEFEE